MTFFGLALTLPLIALSLALSVLPVWLAAKVVGTGRQEFWRVALALVVVVALAVVLVAAAGGWGLLLSPLVFVVVFGKLLDTSYLAAFVLCILALAFQVIVAKFFGALLA
jgi:hypothetical protein